MNPGILYSTLLRLTRPSGLLSLFFAIVVVPVCIALNCKNEVEQTIIRSLLLGPVVPMFVAYSLVKSEVGNSKSLSDGEYLSLVFTRPISRANYVLSKWVVCSLFVTLVVFAQLLVFKGAVACFGNYDAINLDQYVLVNTLLNSFGVTSIIVLMNSFPPKIGIFVFMIMSYATMVGSFVSESVLSSEKSGEGQMFFTAVMNIFHFFRTFGVPSIDSFAILNAPTFDFQAVIRYFSNVCLYLTLGVIILSRREFFYASE